MSIPSIKFDVNTHVREALVQLSILLDDYCYSQHAKERILAYTALHGTPSCCPELDVEDEHDAELIFTAELPAIPYEDAAWDDDGSVLLDVPMLLAGVHPFPVMDPSEAELISHESPDGPVVARKMIDAGTLPPIAGGAPTYEPDELDWREYSAWSRHLEELRDIEREREWWRRNSLERFNEQRTDGREEGGPR
jgi:hypothetical protein